MAQNQPVKAIDVIPSDTINIPQPGSVVGGNSSTNGTTLTDASATFLADSISGGDVVYAQAAGPVGPEIHEILSVDDGQTITLKTAVAAGAPYAYKIYKGNGGELKEGFDGYSLFVGTAGDVAVLPVGTGQDEVILKNVANNSYVPLQVQRVLDSGTTAADILALE
tara:strand:- start:8 stop:505 length:498 start_codon:yes stop_codon:yes gene_type:complete